MQAIVLVGGEGTRLRPLTYGTPKPMVPIMNVPFLARTLERLYAADIREVILPPVTCRKRSSSTSATGAQLGHEGHVRDRGDAARHGRGSQERRSCRSRARFSSSTATCSPASICVRCASITKRKAASVRCISFESRIRRRLDASCMRKMAGSLRSSKNRQKGKNQPTKSTPAPICSNERSSISFRQAVTSR